MILKLDFGNSRLKWMSTNCSDSCSASYDELPKFRWADFAEVRLVSVRDEGTTLKLLREMGLNDHPKLLSATTCHARFPCYYQNPERLGADRFVAAIAAAKIHSKCVVVDAGTALTIDLVDGGFRGGVIALGIQKSIQALLSGTDRIGMGSEAQGGELPVTTKDAVERGAWMQSVGAITCFSAQYGKGLPLVITGGDGAQLAQFITNATYHPNLILDGLDDAEFKSITT